LVSTGPVNVSEPLDESMSVAARDEYLDDVSCFNRRGTGSIGLIE